MIDLAPSQIQGLKLAKSGDGSVALTEFETR